MGIYKIEQKRLPLREQWILNYVNFLACVLLPSDWLKNNQLLSKLTHAQYRDTVPLSNLQLEFGLMIWIVSFERVLRLSDNLHFVFRAVVHSLWPSLYAVYAVTTEMSTQTSC